jgi:indole-3-glycerol phosphate synthase
MILDEIVAHKHEEVAVRKREVPLSELEERMALAAPPRDFRAALRASGISLIAEVKRASPSKGDILPGVDAVDIAAAYEQAGARAISVLTDHRFFKGSLDDLSSVHRAVALPCLRKEFIVDPYQVYESRAAEADAILLIVRILPDELLRDLYQLARALRLAVLVETHSADEIERALKVGAHTIGINNRDLDTLAIDINTTLELRKRVPGGNTLVSESGIHTRDQVRRLEDGGVDAILVGESILTSGNPRAKIRQLLERDES